MTSDKKLNFLLWQLPTIVFITGLFTGALPRTILWVISLSFMGISCISNASKCGRIHCFYNGPFYLFGAIFTLIYGIGLISIQNGWVIIGISVLTGAYFFRYIPEMIWGKYKSLDEH